MATYAIGDIQGCFGSLERLLKQIKFNPKRDVLWFAGDLVNRGPHSLETLRFVKSLGDRAITVLGNHDMHLLALWRGYADFGDKEHTLGPILKARDSEELLEWLRRRPFIHRDKKTGFYHDSRGAAAHLDYRASRKRGASSGADHTGQQF